MTAAKAVQVDRLGTAEGDQSLPQRDRALPVTTLYLDRHRGCRSPFQRGKQLPEPVTPALRAAAQSEEPILIF